MGGGGEGGAQGTGIYLGEPSSDEGAEENYADEGAEEEQEDRVAHPE